MKRLSVTLCPSHIAYCLAVGKGNISRGIRAILDHYMEAHKEDR